MSLQALENIEYHNKGTHNGFWVEFIYARLTKLVDGAVCKSYFVRRETLILTALEQNKLSQEKSLASHFKLE